MLDQNENELKNLIDFNATDVEDGTTQSRFTWRLDGFEGISHIWIMNNLRSIPVRVYSHSGHHQIVKMINQFWVIMNILCGCSEGPEWWRR